MTSIIAGIIIISVCVIFFVAAFAINQTIPVPEECKIAMEDSGCSVCNKTDACTTKTLIQGYIKDKKESTEV